MSVEGYPRLAIVGAGLGGMALAAILERDGVPFTVYEQAPAFARVGAGITLSPNVMRVLQGIDLEEPLKEVAFNPRCFRSRDAASGAITFEIALGETIASRYGASNLIAHRADLHRLLCEAVPAHRIEFNKKLVGLSPTGSEIRLDFADGSVALADAVIGSDGVHSPVREHLLGPERPFYTGEIAYRSVFPASLLGGLELDDMAKWWAEDRHIVIYFLTNRRDEVYFVTGVPEPDWKTESWSTPGDLGELCRAFAGFHPIVRQVVEAAPQVQKWALIARDPLPVWCEGPVALMGDACHPMLPYMGQGGAMAMEDAAVLARCLREAGYEDFPTAFSRYQATRKPRTDEIQRQSKGGAFLRNATDPGWVYGYDAWSVPLAV